MLNINEIIDLVCVKNNKTVVKQIKRKDIKSKMSLSKSKGWTATPYQQGFYQNTAI